MQLPCTLPLTFHTGVSHSAIQGLACHTQSTHSLLLSPFLPHKASSWFSRAPDSEGCVLRKGSMTREGMCAGLRAPEGVGALACCLSLKSLQHRTSAAKAKARRRHSHLLRCKPTSAKCTHSGTNAPPHAPADAHDARCMGGLRLERRLF